MYTYNPASTIADEFINHEEILETLAYADENKNNEALIDSILEKAKLRKGLTHREASVLLACLRKKTRKSITWQSKSKKTSMETVLLCLLRFIFPTIVSMDVLTVLIMQRINIFRERN